MKLKHLLSIAAFVLPLAMFGRPATPAVLTFTNPDGSEINLRLHGDEHFNFNTDVECKYIYERDDKGFWRKAMREGRYLQTDREEDMEILRSENVDNFVRFERNSMMRMAELDKEGRTTYPTLADDIHSLVVLVQFKDTKFTLPNTRELFYNMLNQRGFSEYGARGCAAEYYEACSNGKFVPKFDISPIVTLSQNSEYYAGNRYDNMRDFVVEAMTQLEEQGFDLSKYDYDNNGVIDTVFFFYAGYGRADTGKEGTIWPHQYDYSYENMEFGGLRFGPYACSCELKGPISSNPGLDGIGAFCHEYGHVLGLPDLYDAHYQNNGGSKLSETPGVWSVMDQGSYNMGSTCPPIFSGYEQWLCRWLDYEVAQDGTQLELNSVSSPERNIYRVNLTSGKAVMKNEYYILECRSSDSYDVSLPDHGMVMWRISYNQMAWMSNMVNYNGRSRCIPMASKKGTGKSYAWPGIANRTTITTGDVDWIDTWTVDYNLLISNIAYDEEAGRVTCDYNMGSAPTIAPVFESGCRNNNGSSIKLVWSDILTDSGYESVEYVTSVYRTTTSQKYILGNWDETPTSRGARYVQIYNISSLNREREWTLEVLPYLDGIPSINRLSHKFIPNNLEVGDINDVPVGVEDILGDEDDSVIITGAGWIMAPEGAQIFNMQGLRVGSDNLPAGIYIVRTGSKSTKVMVK